MRRKLLTRQKELYSYPYFYFREDKYNKEVRSAAKNRTETKPSWKANHRILYVNKSNVHNNTNILYHKICENAMSKIKYYGETQYFSSFSAHVLFGFKALRRVQRIQQLQRRYQMKFPDLRLSQHRWKNKVKTEFRWDEWALLLSWRTHLQDQ